MKKFEMQLALAMEKTKQEQKQLKDKDVEKAKAEHAAFDVSMTKTTQSLTAQLRDVAWAFCSKVWSVALDAIGVEVDSNLRGAEKEYYPLTLRFAPSTPPLPPSNPSSTSSAPKSITTSTTMHAPGKDKEQPTPMSVVELESKEVVEVEQLKRNKKDEKQVIV